MKFVEQSYEFITPLDRDAILKRIEVCGRTCYKSEEKITEDSASKFVKNLVERGHEAMIEHVNLTIKFITDRGISHEIVRHRLASFAQSSTRYCNYSQDKFGNELTFITPVETNESEIFTIHSLCMCAETSYMSMVNNGTKPEIARSILPNCLKTEIVMTANLREWRHFLKLRTAPSAHPQIRALTKPLLAELQEVLPEIFGDIKGE
jgi:thymidylate synthase (FAD)